MSNVIGIVIAVSSLLFAVGSWLIGTQARIAGELLSEGLKIHAYEDAWILEGPEFQKQKISDNPTLDTKEKQDGLWLRKVEVRVVLDEAEWTKPSENNKAFYGIIEGKRVWIVRDYLSNKNCYEGFTTGDVPHPALISSRAQHELRGWIERVASYWSPYGLGRIFLPKSTLSILQTLLKPLARSDIAKWYNKYLEYGSSLYL